MIEKIVFVNGILKADFGQFKNVTNTEVIESQDHIFLNIDETINISDSINFVCGVCGNKISPEENHNCMLDVRHLTPEKNARLEISLINITNAVIIKSILFIGTKIAKSIPTEKLIQWVKDTLEIIDKCD